MTFKLKNRNFVKSSNFALNSDVVYSEVISNSEIEKLSHLDIYVMDKNKFYTFYKLKKFKVKSGDIIFCNSLMLECLFYDLKKLKNLWRLKLACCNFCLDSIRNLTLLHYNSFTR